MTTCSHGIRFEDRCNLCVEEGVARANAAAMQTPGPTTPVNVDGFTKPNPIYIQHAPTQGNHHD